MSSPAGRVATNADSLRGRTQWSLVFAGDAGAAPAQEALAELCVRYGFPVYAYLRRCGHAPAAATRGLHGFLQHLDAPRPEAESLPASFRPWLLGELHRFLALPRAADDPAAAPRLSPAELERRYGAEAEPGLSPEAAYHRDFAREVLARAQQRLHAEAAQAGREALYTQLAPYLAREPAQ